ncbi:MAG: MFS transporter [Gammaproteobacteria bacterium]|nr:MAG: MFS transporter [Gammaproteobacteria bacterium]
MADTEASPPASKNSAFKSSPTRLLNRDFLLLWQGQTVSAVGTSLFQIAILYWLMETTGSATIMGLVSMLGALPGVILGPFGGAIADRFSRKKLIVLGDAILGLSMLSLAVPFFLIEGAIQLKIVWIIAVSMLVGIVGAFFRPAVTASIPSLVPFGRLNAANSMNAFSMSSSMALGQAAGGVLYRILGAPMLIFINGISYLLSALSEVFIRIPQQQPEAIKSSRELGRAFIEDIRVGLKYVWNKVGLRNMMAAFALLNFVMAPLGVLLPILLDKWLLLPPDWFGYLMAAMGVGSLFGMMFAGMVRIDGVGRFVCILSALYAMSLANLVFGFATNPFLLIAANMMSGFFMGILIVSFTTLMQATTPDELRGRVSSVMMTVMMGTVPLARGLAGVLADLVDQNIPLLFISAGTISGTLVTVIAFNKPFREFLATRLFTTDQQPGC